MSAAHQLQRDPVLQPLFGENAVSVIALGQCYWECFVGGNASRIHIDWMIGSGHVDIDGIGQNGGITPVMRKGEWALGPIAPANPYCWCR